jgi:hypothetical protein
MRRKLQNRKELAVLSHHNHGIWSLDQVVEVVPSSIGDEGNPWTAQMRFEAGVDEQEIHLWQCLMHLSQQ